MRKPDSHALNVTLLLYLSVIRTPSLTPSTSLHITASASTSLRISRGPRESLSLSFIIILGPSAGLGVGLSVIVSQGLGLSASLSVQGKDGQDGNLSSMKDS